MELVVEKIYDKLPKAAQVYFTKEKNTAICQELYNDMFSYAHAYIGTKALIETDERVFVIGDKTAEELLAQFVKATLTELERTAKTYKIDTEGLKTKEDYAKAIARFVLNHVKS